MSVKNGIQNISDHISQKCFAKPLSPYKTNSFRQQSLWSGGDKWQVSNSFSSFSLFLCISDSIGKWSRHCQKAWRGTRMTLSEQEGMKGSSLELSSSEGEKKAEETVLLKKILLLKVRNGVFIWQQLCTMLVRSLTGVDLSTLSLTVMCVEWKKKVSLQVLVNIWSRYKSSAAGRLERADFVLESASAKK